MWEFCISVDKNKLEIKNFMYEKCIAFMNEYSGVATIDENQISYNILLAINEYEKNRLVIFLRNLIDEVICFFYKKDFLCENLILNIQDEMTKQAFIFSLLYFDKETDKFIVNKYLNLDKKLDLDGFYNFRLSSLKDKWRELIDIANQNEIYLYSDDTFTELIKFLIDNLEIQSDVINIMQKDNSYAIYDSNFNPINIYKETNKNEGNLMAEIITMCPKNINIYCSDIMPNKLKDLICKLFEKRVRFISKIN